MNYTLILVIAIVLLIAFMIVKYNRLIALKTNRENAFADIDVYLKKRIDLIPNLVETVKSYASHEKELFENVTKARTSCMNATNADSKIESENMLSWALKSLFAVSEAYPDLKANQNFMQMQTDLKNIEWEVASVREFFNNTTKEFNAFIQMFPNNIIAKMFGFNIAKYFEVENRETLQDAPKVSFS